MDADHTRPVDMERFRADYWGSLQWEEPFYVQRPPAFSPAAAAQEHYSQSSMMWKFISQWLPWQYTSFADESMSFHESAYLGDWSSLTKFRISGPDATRFLSAYCANSFREFEVGRIKHSIQPNEAGKVVGEGLLVKLGEDEFRYTGGGAYWLDHWFRAGGWDAQAQLDSPEEFVFAVQGPASLAVMEAVTGSDLRGLDFGWATTAPVDGHPCRILRAGVTGELGYEIHGPAELGNQIWSSVRDAGQQHGLRLLGGRSQLVSHVEHGFATIGRDFWPATSTRAADSRAHRLAPSGGSLEWDRVTDLTRSPLELGWGRFVAVDDHDFMGRDALAEEKARGPERRWVGLEWSSEDVVDVYASLFRDGPLTTHMDMPRTVHRHAMNPDQVLHGGELVGVSTSRAYSTFLRRMISLCVLRTDLAVPGTAVTVVWGDRGAPQREIRATVRELPFKPDNRRTDVRSR